MILIPGLLQFLKRIFWDDDIPVIPERRNLDPNTMEFVVDILERKGEGMKGASEKDTFFLFLRFTLHKKQEFYSSQ